MVTVITLLQRQRFLQSEYKRNELHCINFFYNKQTSAAPGEAKT